MSSLAKHGRMIRGAVSAEEDVIVVGETVRNQLPTGALASMAQILEAAEIRANEIIIEAESRALQLEGETEARVEQARSEGFDDGRRAGYEFGIQRAEHEIAGLLEVARAAARDGIAIRDAMIAQASELMADAVTAAVCRLAAGWYEEDPRRTAAVCEEALRAASGQEILTIRVNPAVSDHVQAALVHSTNLVLPDSAVEIGGCIVDVRGGTVIATLESREGSLREALRRASGAAA